MSFEAIEAALAAEYDGITVTVTLPMATTEKAADRIGESLTRIADANGLEILVQFDDALAVVATGGGKRGRAFFEAKVRELLRGALARG